jgi:hypothetical protein
MGLGWQRMSKCTSPPSSPVLSSAETTQAQPSVLATPGWLSTASSLLSPTSAPAATPVSACTRTSSSSSISLPSSTSASWSSSSHASASLSNARDCDQGEVAASRPLYRSNFVYSGSDSEAALRAVHRLVITERTPTGRASPRPLLAGSRLVEDRNSSADDYTQRGSAHSEWEQSGISDVSSSSSRVSEQSTRAKYGPKRNTEKTRAARRSIERRCRPTKRPLASHNKHGKSSHGDESADRHASTPDHSRSSSRASIRSRSSSTLAPPAKSRRRTPVDDGEFSTSTHVPLDSDGGDTEATLDESVLTRATSDKAQPVRGSASWTQRSFGFGAASTKNKHQKSGQVAAIGVHSNANLDENVDHRSQNSPLQTAQPMDLDDVVDTDASAENCPGADADAAIAPDPENPTSTEDPDSRVVSCAVFPSDDWGSESDADSWCFLCEWRVPPDQIADNRYYSTLLDLFSNSRHQRNVDLCRNIQRYYNENFALAHDGRVWTLRSIRAHQYEHMGVSTAFMYDDLIRTLYAQTQLYCATGLRLRDTQTNKQYVNHKGMRSYIDTTRQLLNVIRQAE